MSTFKVGDTVVVLDANFAPRRTQIEKIGRKKIYLKGNSTPFCIERHVALDAYGHQKLISVEEHELNVRAEEARTQLRSHGVTLDQSLPKERMCKIWETLKPLLAPETTS